MKKKQLRHKQFLQLWYNRCGIKNKAVESHMEDIYNGLLTTIAEEVRLNGDLKFIFSIYMCLYFLSFLHKIKRYISSEL